MKAKQLLFLSAAAFGLFACAGPNPNPGERTADMAWDRRDYETVHSIIRPAAERGEPWAQLRLGVIFELGVGVAKDTTEALKWYRQAAVQTADGGWANGELVGATGKLGFFNQNTDALIAQYQIANIYLRGDGVHKDLVEAYQWSKNVSDKTQGRNLFYCCEYSGGRFITANAISETLKKIESELTTEQKKRATDRFKDWTPR